MYSFPDLEPVRCSMSSSNCCFMTCIQISQETGQVVWYSHIFKNFLQVTKSHVWLSDWSLKIYTLSCFLNLFVQTVWPASWEICMQVKKQQFELDTQQRIGSKLGKEYVKAVSCHPAYLTYMQSTSWEMLYWMKHKLESKIARRNINNLIHRRHYPYLRKWRTTKEPLDESERGEWKSWLKTQHSEK